MWWTKPTWGVSTQYWKKVHVCRLTCFHLEIKQKYVAVEWKDRRTFDFLYVSGCCGACDVLTLLMQPASSPVFQGPFHYFFSEGLCLTLAKLQINSSPPQCVSVDMTWYCQGAVTDKTLTLSSFVSSEIDAVPCLQKYALQPQQLSR